MEKQSTPNDVLVVDAKGIHKAYKLGHRFVSVLTGASLSLKKGEMVAILGASGAGKSTLLHLIGALDLPDAGLLRVVGDDISSMSSFQMAQFRNRSIGFVFQFHHLLPEFTALENVAMPALIDGDLNAYAKATELLSQVGLLHRKDHHPYELSGGEQQRAALARALINEPSLLLADEPTGNLDPKTADSVYELMCELNRRRGLAALVVTHNEELAARLDRRLYLHEGKLFHSISPQGDYLA